MMESPVMPLTVPMPEPAVVTVRVAEAVKLPVYPLILAVMVVVPADSPVATPEESILATAGTLEVQAAVSVSF
jgi:hypothetical protein